MMNDIIFLKKQQREKFTSIRKAISKKNTYRFNPINIDQLLKNKKLNNLKIISSFFSIKSEIPTADLNEYLISKKKILLFPVVNPKSKILSFRKFKKNQNLVEGSYKIPEPPLENEELIPNLIFVPCLAFDIRGYRLGYGGGYYDSTFAYFKSINHQFISVGFAYDDQKVNGVIRDQFDYKLNFVLTEKQLYTFV